jgi:hypothetical protein
MHTEYIGIPEGRRRLGILRHRWEGGGDKIKMDLKDLGVYTDFRRQVLTSLKKLPTKTVYVFLLSSKRL